MSFQIFYSSKAILFSSSFKYQTPIVMDCSNGGFQEAILYQWRYHLPCLSSSGQKPVTPRICSLASQGELAPAHFAIHTANSYCKVPLQLPYGPSRATCTGPPRLQWPSFLTKKIKKKHFFTVGKNCQQERQKISNKRTENGVSNIG